MNNTPKNLQEFLDLSGGPLKRLSATGLGGYVFPVVPPEQTSWLREQRAWAEACVLMDQTHHMDDLHIAGPDVVKLLSDTAVNNFAKFRPGMAKQYIACTEEGFLIGDAILTYLLDGTVVAAGLGPAINWLDYKGRTGGYNVTLKRDARSSSEWGTPVTRKLYRYQLQGPKAWALIEKLNGASMAETKFFHMTTFSIAGRKVEALRHGMAGAAGLEFWGPIEEQQCIRDTILKAGEEFGLQQVGNRAYGSSAVESAWLGPLMPAIYTSTSLQAYREWLPAFTLEAFFQLGGSFHSEKMEDYYKTPFDLSYDAFIHFEHDFIGRDALRAMAKDRPAQRKKVTLEWLPEEAMRIFNSLFQDSPKYKQLELPLAQYAFALNDRIMRGNQLIGLGVMTAYSANASRIITLASVDSDVNIGDAVDMVWGEEPGRYHNIRVEPHVQTTIRARVCPAPYSRVAREELRQA